MIPEKPGRWKELTEYAFQTEIILAARENGWRFVYHVPDSRGATEKGIPDLILLRQGFLLFLEVKAENGQVRKEQREFFEMMGSIYGPIRAMIVRPRDWDEVMRILDNPWGAKGQMMLGANP